MLTLTLLAALLLGNLGATTSTTPPAGTTNTAPESNQETPPPVDTDARAHIIDIG